MLLLDERQLRQYVAGTLRRQLGRERWSLLRRGEGFARWPDWRFDVAERCEVPRQVLTRFGNTHTFVHVTPSKSHNCLIRSS
jgi:hypothetical protein